MCMLEARAGHSRVLASKHCIDDRAGISKACVTLPGVSHEGPILITHSNKCGCPTSADGPAPVEPYAPLAGGGGPACAHRRSQKR